MKEILDQLRMYIEIKNNKSFKIKNLEKYNLSDNTEIILLFNNGVMEQ